MTSPDVAMRLSVVAGVLAGQVETALQKQVSPSPQERPAAIHVLDNAPDYSNLPHIADHTGPHDLSLFTSTAPDQLRDAPEQYGGGSDIPPILMGSTFLTTFSEMQARNPDAISRLFVHQQLSLEHIRANTFVFDISKLSPAEQSSGNAVGALRTLIEAQQRDGNPVVLDVASGMGLVSPSFPRWERELGMRNILAISVDTQFSPDAETSLRPFLAQQFPAANELGVAMSVVLPEGVQAFTQGQYGGFADIVRLIAPPRFRLEQYLASLQAMKPDGVMILVYDTTYDEVIPSTGSNTSIKVERDRFLKLLREQGAYSVEEYDASRRQVLEDPKFAAAGTPHSMINFDPTSVWADAPDLRVALIRRIQAPTQEPERQHDSLPEVDLDPAAVAQWLAALGGAAAAAGALLGRRNRPRTTYRLVTD